jgi:excisionase family DNA binding protein
VTDSEIIDGWITTDRAASLTGYRAAYLSELARSGRVKAQKMGRDWWLDREDLLRYKATMDELGSRRHDPRRNPQWIESKRSNKA